MKQVFWTTIFWLAALALFGGYLRWFDQNLAQDVSSLVVKNTPITDIQEITTSGSSCGIPTAIASGSIITGDIQGDAQQKVITKLDLIQSKLQDINDKLDMQSGSMAIDTAKNAIEKTANQYSQIKKVIIIPEEALQP